MLKLQKMMWMDVVEHFWTVRNDILHHQKKFDEIEEERMAQRILWYVKNKHNIMSVHDQFLARFDETQVNSMKRAQKREWLRHFDVAREAYNKDKTQRS